MRAKDGLDAENKTSQRTLDRQNKLLEKAQETERNLQAQLNAQEQVITKLKTALTELQKQVTVSSSEKTALEHQLQHSQKHLAEVSCFTHRSSSRCEHE
jgi:septal ring factor EnvC (AmiA/AmiB activator)